MVLTLAPSSAHANGGRGSLCQYVFGKNVDATVSELAARINEPRYIVGGKARAHARQKLYYDVVDMLSGTFDVLESRELAWRVVGAPRKSLSLRTEKMDVMILFHYFDQITAPNAFTQPYGGPSLKDWIHLAQRNKISDSPLFLGRILSLEPPALPSRLSLTISRTLKEGMTFNSAEKDFIVELLSVHFDERTYSSRIAVAATADGTLTPFKVGQNFLPFTRLPEFRSHPSFIELARDITDFMQELADETQMHNSLGQEIERIMGFSAPSAEPIQSPN